MSVPFVDCFGCIGKTPPIARNGWNVPLKLTGNRSEERGDRLKRTITIHVESAKEEADPELEKPLLDSFIETITGQAGVLTATTDYDVLIKFEDS